MVRIRVTREASPWIDRGVEEIEHQLPSGISRSDAERIARAFRRGLESIRSAVAALRASGDWFGVAPSGQ